MRGRLLTGEEIISREQSAMILMSTVCGLSLTLFSGFLSIWEMGSEAMDVAHSLHIHPCRTMIPSPSR